ncbi:aminopeptidase P N-terminal domain-containing protein [Anaeromyxobacter paludicola]|uniref:Xaa-Pro aminopeptidase n=1 Tax=Anaeromyxobacter paludicola TaxID=2918171 RepID=A0ABN6N9R4_9BACT|nr:aminopeptidase P N-terminal domain-containing protein [Anaeromyxobacter paludicola]BDG08668.1 Xaa-Pro aminopeptidase [Anaeromyxobacter paludicola]
MDRDLEIFRRRRAAILHRMRALGGGVLLLPAADEKSRNADAEYPFRQDSDFHYATGFDEPQGCALLFAGRCGPEADGEPDRPELVMFVRPRDKEKEIWNGRRAGVEGACELYGADQAFPVAELELRLPALLDKAGPLWFRLGNDATWDARVARALADLRSRARAGAEAPREVKDVGPVMHELRLVKSPEEVARLRRAAEITAEAHMGAMRDGMPGRKESQVQAEIEYAFRRRGGSGPGYGTIVATGENACVLHYRAGETVLKDGELCLVDAGGEYELYTADVTRTFPVSGAFTKPQRALYEVVLQAQLEAMAAVRPGVALESVHDLCVRRLTEGMIRLGLLQGTVEERLEDKGYRRYYMHRTSHWLGLDVHDVGAYFVDGKPRVLAPGMVLTIEPGLYVAPDDAEAPAEYRGMGIRIEDDVLVTPEGMENLTDAVPKTVEEIEAVCVR